MKKLFFFFSSQPEFMETKILSQIYRFDQLIENLKKCLRRGEGHEELTNPCSCRIALLHEVLQDDEFGPGLPGKEERR